MEDSNMPAKRLYGPTRIEATSAEASFTQPLDAEGGAGNFKDVLYMVKVHKVSNSRPPDMGGRFPCNDGGFDRPPRRIKITKI